MKQEQRESEWEKEGEEANTELRLCGVFYDILN